MQLVKKLKKSLPPIDGMHFAVVAESFIAAVFCVAPRDPFTVNTTTIHSHTIMAKLKLEYLWLDGYTPVANLRGKTKIEEGDPSTFSLEDCPMWGFDGSSTQQADGSSSDCMLKPIAIFPGCTRTNGFLVMCEVLNPDGTPHPSNARATIAEDEGLWVGLEQEYFLQQDGRPIGWPEDGYPAPQGEYYCGAGYTNVGDIARQIVEEHLDICLAAGINHEGINGEVAKGQWEFQIFGKGAHKACRPGLGSSLHPAPPV